MRILFDARRSVPRVTGIGRFIDGLLPALAGLDARNEYLVLTSDKNPLSGVDAANIEVRRLALPHNSPGVNTVMPALARQWRADVAYFPYWLAPLWMPCPFVVAIHDLIQVFRPEGFSAGHRLLFRTYGRLAARRAARVHALAPYGRGELTRVFGLSPDRVDVVAPGIELPAAPLWDPQACAESGRPFALYVGNHKPHKNLEQLLRAFARVADQLSVDLVIAGAKSSLSDPAALPHLELVKALSLTERVRFAGQVDDAELGRLYRAACYFIFPSLYEGFGLPPLEAMSYGTPVACSNSTSLPGVVGDAALMFDPASESSIADALVTIDRGSELRTELSRRGRARAATFTWDASARAWLDSLLKCAAL